MIEALKLLDPYNRQARLFPALLTLLPPVATALAWMPDLAKPSVGGAALTLVATCGGLYLLSDLARSRGKRLEPQLLTAWGGWPSTRLLRHCDPELSEVAKDRYRGALTAKIGLSWPTAADELADPGRADETYRSATDWLREQTRGSEHGRLLAENTRYGFRRNLMGLRSWGIVLCLLALVGSTLGLGVVSDWSATNFIRQIANGDELGKLAAAGLAICALSAWLFGVNEAWVKKAANEYARTLLASCDTLK